MAPLGTLTRRRFALTARTPRELLVPLLTPVLFAVVIAPALQEALGGLRGGGSYASFVAIATVGLLVPLNTMFSGIGVIIDRESGEYLIERRAVGIAPTAAFLVARSGRGRCPGAHAKRRRPGRRRRPCRSEARDRR